MKQLATIFCGILVGFLAFFAYHHTVAATNAVHAAGGMNIVVLCATCTLGDVNSPMGALILDQNSGNVWFYEGGMSAGADAKLLGRVPEIGKAMVPAK